MSDSIDEESVLSRPIKTLIRDYGNYLATCISNMQPALHFGQWYAQELKAGRRSSRLVSRWATGSKIALPKFGQSEMDKVMRKGPVEFGDED